LPGWAGNKALLEKRSVLIAFVAVRAPACVIALYTEGAEGCAFLPGRLTAPLPADF
jgi:hypothetical protein